jgi:hypothetical protein
MYLGNLVVPSEIFATSASDDFMKTSIPMAADFYHKEYAEFLKLINHPFILHRKLWEWLYITRKLRDYGVLAEGARGLCFGSGKEPLPAIFAQLGCKITATDAPVATVAGTWADSDQHAQGLADLQRPDIIDNKTFAERVAFECCDMNAISKHLTSFDFCWSSSSLDHLGSLKKGIDFIIHSVEETLKVGGVACHTTELNLSSDTHTVETENLSVYRRCDLEYLAAEVRARGHEIAPFIIKTGCSPIDYFVDVPPYSGAPHLKLQVEHYVITSVGIVIRRGR